MFKWLGKKNEASPLPRPSGPDWSRVDTREKADALVAEGELVQLQLFRPGGNRDHGHRLLAVVAGSMLATSAVPAAPLNKCIVDGTVTYQQGPCASDQVRRSPTVQELNAAQKKKREVAASAPPEVPARATPPVSAGFSCDGRKYCSQMSSCAEAKYFLANCPGAKMDGDRNGVPCEKQWCVR